MKIIHTVEHGEHVIIGKVDNTEVITIGMHLNKPPTVMSSTCLPSNIEKAEEYVNCMNIVFDTYANNFKNLDEV